MTFNGP